MKRPRATGKCHGDPADREFPYHGPACLADRLTCESAFYDELTKHRALESCAVLIQRLWLGERSEPFGRDLLKSLLFVLAEKEGKPSTLIFIAGAVALACEDSAVLPALGRMEADGVSLMVCGASLNRHKLRERLRAGCICNMHDIAEVLLRTRRVITL